METAVCITAVLNTGTYTHHCMQSHSICCWFITHEYPPRARARTHTHTHTLMTVLIEIVSWDKKHVLLTWMEKGLLRYWCHIISKYFSSIYVTDLLPMALINKEELQNNRKSYIPWKSNIQKIKRYFKQQLQTTKGTYIISSTYFPIKKQCGLT